MSHKKRMDVWVYIGIVVLALYLLFMLYPMIRLLLSSVVSDEGNFTMGYFRQFFSKNYYVDTISNSLLISTAATFFSLLLGIPFAYFYNLYDMKGKAFLQVIAILCSMSPPFIGAYSWIQLFGRSGIVTKFVRSVFGIAMPSIYGFWGCTLVISFQLFPLVFLYMSGALKNIDNSLLEASSNLGVSKFKQVFKIILPLCMPTILAAALMVFMRAFADFGTPLLIAEGFQTLPVLIYKSYVGETTVNHGFAAAVSAIAILLTAIFFLVQKAAANRFSFTINALHPIERKKTRSKWTGALMHIFCYGMVLFAFLPQAFVVYQSFRNTSGKLFTSGYSLKSYRDVIAKMGRAIPNTLIVGILALVVVLVIATLISYMVVRRRGTLSNTIDVLSMVPYIIPGSVIGIALVISFNGKPLALTGTVAIMVIALVIRRIPYTIRSSVAILQQIPLSMEEAAISLGSSKLKAFTNITIPMMANGILSGAILSWVTIITELSTSIILYTTSTTTMTLAIYTYVTRGNDGLASAMAAILVYMTTGSLLLFTRFSKNKELAF